MKKILLVVHGSEFPFAALDFIIKLNEKMPLLLTGFFLPEIVPIENWAAYSAQSTGSLEDVVTATNIETFKQKCKQHHIEYRVHEGTNELATPQIIKETRYADLMVAGSSAFYTEDRTEDSFDSLKKIMRQAECPALIVPGHARFPEKIMIAYDGSEASVFAMKQFAYLFPELCSMETEIVHMADDKHVLVPDKGSVAEWAGKHFSNLSIHPVTYSSGEYFASEANASAVLVVTGSFGRSVISQILRRSFSEDLVEKYHLLLFSAHAD